MSVPSEMLLHPELLTNEQLIYIIGERHLHIPNMESMARDEILDLFHRYCVPFGQRKYRDSGRGKLLNKTRHSSPEAITKLDVINNSQNRKTLNVCSERLKPPPDLLSGHMKRIKLESKLVPVNEILNINKRKMSVDMIPDSPPIKKEKKTITWP